MKLLLLDLCSGLGGWTAAFRHRGHDCVGLDLNPNLGPDILMDIIQMAQDPGRALDGYVRKGWRPDAILAGPPCEGFSVGSVGKMWDRTPNGFVPKHDTARQGVKVLEAVLMAVAKLQPLYYWIENPRGMMRKMPQMKAYRHVEISQCCYGNVAQKMTDLWGRFPVTWMPRALCDAKPDLGIIDLDGRAYDVIRPTKAPGAKRSPPVAFVKRRDDGELCPVEKGKVWVDGVLITMRVLKPNGLPCHEWSPRGANTGTQGKDDSSLRAKLPYALSEEVCVALEKEFYARHKVPGYVREAWVHRQVALAPRVVGGGQAGLLAP